MSLITGDPLHSWALAHSCAPLFTQQCPHCSHSRAPGEQWSRLCVFTLQGCVQTARLCRGSPVLIPESYFLCHLAVSQAYNNVIFHRDEGGFNDILKLLGAYTWIKSDYIHGTFYQCLQITCSGGYCTNCPVLSFLFSFLETQVVYCLHAYLLYIIAGDTSNILMWFKDINYIYWKIVLNREISEWILHRPTSFLGH